MRRIFRPGIDSQRSSVTSRLVVTLVSGLLAVGVTGIALAQEDPPNVVGMQVDEAVAILEEAGYEVDVVFPGVDIDPDLVVVFSQENFPEDQFVRIFPGTFVPDLTGMTGSEAEAAVSSHGLVPFLIGEQTEDSQVVSQIPRPGELVEFGTSVEAELGTGGGFPWFWIVVVVVLVLGVPTIRRISTNRPADGDEQDDRDHRPHSIRAETRLGDHSLTVGDPSAASADHALRVELVVGPLHQQYEEADQ